MKIFKLQHIIFAAAIAMGIAGLSPSAAASLLVDLQEFGVNLDGTTFCSGGGCDSGGLGDFSTVPGVDQSGFDFSTGLGTLSFTITGAGSHNLDLFLDHDLDRDGNGYLNEVGFVGGGPLASGQSVEIDEPGFVYGDIFTNFVNSAYDGTNGVSDPNNPGGPDDPSMGIGWDFVLGVGEIANISFLVSQSVPSSIFFLGQMDVDNEDKIFFSSGLEIAPPSTVPEPSNTVPEPSTLAVFSFCLAGLGFMKRRSRTAKMKV